MGIASRASTAGRTSLVVASLVVTADAATKTLAVWSWTQRTRPVGPVTLHVLRNPGGPFGLAPHATVWFTALALVSLPIAAQAATLVKSRLGIYGVGMLLGGIVGNLSDRLLRAPDPFRGAVVDWLRVAPYRPTFNIADVALRGGGMLTILAFARRDRGAQPTSPCSADDLRTTGYTEAGARRVHNHTPAAERLRRPGERGSVVLVARVTDPHLASARRDPCASADGRAGQTLRFFAPAELHRGARGMLGGPGRVSETCHLHPFPLEGQKT